MKENWNEWVMKSENSERERETENGNVNELVLTKALAVVGDLSG